MSGLLKKLSWYVYRMKLMSFEELFIYRTKQFLQSQVSDRLMANSPIVLKSLWTSRTYKTYNKQSLNSLFERAPWSYDYSFFTTSLNLKTYKSWRSDLKHGIISDIAFSNSIAKQNFQDVGDIKYVFDPARMHFLPYLALHVANTDQDTSLLKTLLSSWHEQNPFLNSIHWTSGIEVGIRTVNLTLTHAVLSQLDLLDDELDKQLQLQLQSNLWFLTHHLSLHSSANNHLIAELVGINVINHYFLGHTSDEKIAHFRNMLFTEFEKQVNKDGVNFELSSGYHKEVIDHFLIAFQFINNAGIDVPLLTSTKFKSMFDFVRDSKQGGKVVFGDSDEGYIIYPHFESSFDFYDSILQTQSILSDTKPDHPIDFRNYLIFGESALSEKSPKKITQKSLSIYPQSGYFFVYHKDVKLSCDFGPIGDKLSAAHGHSDLLHFNFQKNGVTFLGDSGTYQYHQRHELWRNYFRGISAHNCVSVAGLNHALSNNRMSWIKTPDILDLKFEDNDSHFYCYGGHNGFIKQDVPVKHFRKVQLLKHENRVEIEDRLSGEGSHKVQFYLQIGTDLEGVELVGEKLMLQAGTEQITITNEFFPQAKIIEGSEEPILGWYSNQYDVKSPRKTLFLELEFLGSDLIFKTIIDF